MKAATVELTYNTPAGTATTTIRGEWPQGAYVDLYFGDARTPTEVVNVHDYRTGHNGIVDMLQRAREVFEVYAPIAGDRAERFNRAMLPLAVETVIRDWIAQQDADELEYREQDYAGDLEAIREVRTQWTASPERNWLMTYLANSR